MSKPLVYIAGPYSSDPVGNTRSAVEAGMALWRSGAVAVLIPHLSMLADLVCPMPVEEWYAFDHDLLERCDAVLRLPGASLGVEMEVAHALELGLPVFEQAETLCAWAVLGDRA